ncbi:uncharacterized protein HKW66_Vig0092840 [Vigna angularis]|uniref:Pentatricopeptide repeat-containing protein n=1 Tax=Phaseolus angularis TaxID=3914 RepID=A0A8T0KP35_PHAAN|nr:uncharacterized protein HKW66_Vig0092840 [Vigna angularis]
MENAVVLRWSKFHYFSLARTLFDTMPQRDAVSSTSIIDGLVNDGRPGVAVHMILSSGVDVDEQEGAGEVYKV